jgi:hypothetical protein
LYIKIYDNMPREKTKYKYKFCEPLCRQKTIYQGACLLGSKCGKTHLRASVKSKNFPPRTPEEAQERKGRGRNDREEEGRWKGGEGWDGEGREGKGKGKGGEGEEERDREGRRREGREGKWKEREWGEVCVMVFEGMDAPAYQQH